MIHTHRLNIVPPSMALQPKMLEAIRESQENLRTFLPWVPNALSEESSVEQTLQAIDNFAQFKNELRFFIIEQQTEQFIGAIGLIIRNETVPFFEIGYWLRSSSVGQGYITEAVHAIEKYAFNELNAQRVEIKMAEQNVKSQQVAIRCGYTFEGILHCDSRLPSGELTNTLIYAKTAL
jgi:RimJ/RimL family protein N-acetyltransferase